MSILFLDLETDGKGDFTNQKIIQISYQIHEKDNFQIKINDFIKGVEYVKEFEGMNRVTVEFLNENGIELKHSLEKLVNNVNSYNVDKIVCHNTNFDLKILNRELNSFNMFFEKDLEEVCTMQLSTDYCKIPFNSYSKRFKWPTLFELAEKLDIIVDNNKLHDASYDVEILQKCFTNLNKVLNKVLN